jgi:hypothetical protein
MSIPTYDLPTLYSNLDQYLTKAQHDLEQAIEAYGVAGENHSSAYAEYRKAKAEAVKTLREDKHPVGVITDLANGLTAESKEKEMRSEYLAKQARMYVDAYQERINMLKYIGRACEGAGA